MGSRTRHDEFPARTADQLGKLLRGYRKEAGLTQQEVASAGGLLQKTVSRIEADPSSASVESIFRILSALNVEVVLRHRDAEKSAADW